MNAAETIQAAIDRLTTMRDISDWGTLEVTGRHPECRVSGDFGEVARSLNDYDAVLIVTLHRTIDAQLAILGAALYKVQTSKRRRVSTVVAAIHLAEAILGGAK